MLPHGPDRRADLTPARLIGRERELAALRAVLSATAAGAGRVAVITGAPGQGKTSLLATVVAGANRERFDVVMLQASALSRDVPFAALTDAFRLRSGSAARDGLFDVPREMSFAIAEDVLAELEQRASVCPVLVVLEDAQWADAGTVTVVRRLAAAAPALPLAVLVTARDDAASPDLRRLLADVRTAGGELLSLPPLASADVAGLVQHAVGAPPDQKLAGVLEAAGGNPLFVLELVEALRHDKGLAVVAGVATTTYDVGVPPALHLTLMTRLAELPPCTLHLLTVASVLGRTFRVAELSALAGVSTAQLLPGLSPALQAGVLLDREQDLAFRHDLIREVLYDEVPLPLRRELHLQAADVVTSELPGDRRGVEHVLLGTADDDPRAPRLLLDAARVFAEVSLAAAVPVLERALSIAPRAHPLHAEIAADLAGALVHVGRAEAGGAVANTALELPVTAEVAVRLLNAAQAAHANMGRNREAAEVAEAAAARPDLPKAERGAFLARAAAARIQHLDVDAARRLAQEAVRLAEEHGDAYSEVLANVTLALVAQADGDPDAAMERARAAHGLAGRTVSMRTGHLTPYRVLSRLLADADRLDDADAVARAGMARAEAASNVAWLPHFHGALATTNFLRGRLDDALAEERAMQRVVDDGEVRHSALLAQAIRVRVATMRDDIAGARRALALAHEHALRGGSGVGLDWLWWAEARLVDDPSANPDVVRRLVESWELFRAASTLGDLRLIGPELVRLAGAVSPDVAREVTDVVGRAATRSPDVASLAGAAQLSRAILEQDADAASAAVAAYRRSPRVLDLARGCELAADVLSSCGRSDAATAALEEALGVYDGSVAVGDGARVRAALRRLGVHRRAPAKNRRAVCGWESLTDTELRVVRLVASGMTNRQTGERLYISPRTVETHLSRVFSKLGVTSRSGLVAASVGRDLDEQVAERR